MVSIHEISGDSTQMKKTVHYVLAKDLKTLVTNVNFAAIQLR